jgi:hypothetical protein
MQDTCEVLSTDHAGVNVTIVGVAEATSRAFRLRKKNMNWCVCGIKERDHGVSDPGCE